MRMSQAICIIYLSEARTEVQRPELASPGAAAVVARRESRSAMPERLKVAARRQLRRAPVTTQGRAKGPAR